MKEKKVFQVKFWWNLSYVTDVLNFVENTQWTRQHLHAFAVILKTLQSTNAQFFNRIHFHVHSMNFDVISAKTSYPQLQVNRVVDITYLNLASGEDAL